MHSANRTGKHGNSCGLVVPLVTPYEAEESVADLTPQPPSRHGKGEQIVLEQTSRFPAPCWRFI